MHLGQHVPGRGVSYTIVCHADMLTDVLMCRPSWPLNSQAFYAAGEDMSYMDYDAEECDTGMQATFHDMSQMELQDNWARCW